MSESRPVGVSQRTKEGTRVRFVPNPISLRLYSKPPALGEEGVVTTAQLPGGRRTFLPGPGGGLLYVQWDRMGTMGVAPIDLVKVPARGNEVDRALLGYMHHVGALKSQFLPSHALTLTVLQALHGRGSKRDALHLLVSREAIDKLPSSLVRQAQKALNQRSGKLKVGPGRPGQRIEHDDVVIETTLHPVVGSNDLGSVDLDEFTKQYIETALWSSVDDDDEPLDSNYGIEDLAPETLKKMVADAEKFQKTHWDEISGDLGRAGHDFWLTRNGHGAGFWDGDWPDPIGDVLTKASEKFGNQHMYVGDDGKLHVMEG